MHVVIMLMVYVCSVLLLSHLSIIGTLIKSLVCSRTYEIPKKNGIPKKWRKKIGIPKKIHMKFQIVRENIGVCRFSLISPVSNPFTN